MQTPHPAVITQQAKASSGEVGSDYTKITFVPDLGRFHMSSGDTCSPSVGADSLLKTAVGLLHKRAFDVAACVQPVVTTFNGDVLLPVGASGGGVPSTKFDSYLQMFLPPIGSGATADEAPMVLHDRINPRWEIALVSPSPTQTFDQVSFVNGVCTTKGGSHVSYISDQITTGIVQEVRRRLGPSKGASVSIGPQMIRNKFMLFVNCNISNPSFDSQSKDSLTTSVDSFGSTCRLTVKSAFMKSLLKSPLIEEIVADVHMKEENKLSKAIKTSRASNNSFSKLHLEVPKLDDARFAGSSVSNKALQCKLILTEGDSAKALAVAGLEVVGREHYGVMPLRGKILNVRDASPDKLMNNEDIISLCKVIGLDFRKTYKDGIANQGLRYGSIVLMTDQDPDGSHIKGLIINLFHHFWPNLLKIDGFLQHFITPLVKVKLRGSKKRTIGSTSSGGVASSVQTKVFYSIPEYLNWCNANGVKQTTDTDSGADSGAGAGVKAMSTGKSIVSVKYYKGLGTNTAEEGKEYFRDLPMHLKLFGSGWSEGDKARSTDRDAAVDNVIDLAFRKDRVQDRKAWLRTVYDASSYIDPSISVTSYEDFINKELIHFSYADNIRSIPSCIDGMKPAQRKVLYACFKKKLTGGTEMKVAQLAGYVAEQTAYHHGEMSLNQTIVRMAQDYVGSNNLPLLQPCGQFGTRNQGGHDHASARYIFTQLSPYARLLFPEADDCLLKHNQEDELIVEPEVYIPIIPMLLVNGSEGIGTGWSTNIPPHNPLDIMDSLETLIKQSRKIGAVSSSQGGSKALVPWVRSFKGTITPDQGLLKGGKGKKSGDNALPSKYIARGKWELADKRSVEVTELPVGVWTSSYKDMLIRAIQAGSGGDTGSDALKIKGFIENHKTNSVNFHIELNRKLKIDAKFSAVERAQDLKMLGNLLKLQTSISVGALCVCA